MRISMHSSCLWYYVDNREGLLVHIHHQFTWQFKWQNLHRTTAAQSTGKVNQEMFHGCCHTKHFSYADHTEMNLLRRKDINECAKGPPALNLGCGRIWIKMRRSADGGSPAANGGVQRFVANLATVQGEMPYPVCPYLLPSLTSYFLLSPPTLPRYGWRKKAMETLSLRDMMNRTIISKIK